MSSGFVPAGFVPGTSSTPSTSTTSPSKPTTDPSSSTSTTSAPPPPEDNRSLYAILQANAAAKQAAFEESIKFKHQFTALDEVDADYLDGVVQAERAERARRRREEGMAVEGFRALQGGLDMGLGMVPVEGEGGAEGGGEKWGKRKRSAAEGKREKGVMGVKVRRKGSGDVGEGKEAEKKETKKAEVKKEEAMEVKKVETKKEAEKKVVLPPSPVKKALPPPPPAVKKPLTLVDDYGSDDSD
ncbi:N-terminal domain of NEFA-interacting nuclear protein NIP30-domain-containing protein [Geopyxis carbonaria]|nr:N-terminal domain of NEFA-interacting nuclear protein NIP30-domain-containing protein [Geopyxis carbonaria]